MKLLDNYLEARKEVLRYFGAVDDGRYLHDERTYFWDVDKGSDSLKYATTEASLLKQQGEYYDVELVEFHEGAEYSLATVRSDFGGDDVGIIFSNDKRRHTKT